MPSPNAPTPIAVENFQMLQERQTSDSIVETDHRRGRTNLLNWDGQGKPGGLFPKGDHDVPKDESAESDPPLSNAPEERP